MTTSPFFNHFSTVTEQALIQDLVTESIQIGGVDIQYLPRTSNTGLDDILNESDISSFNNTHVIEVYVKDLEGFEGDGDLLSKFGLEIRDEITFVVSLERFANVVAPYISGDRPREGDLIFFPFNNKLFEIKFTEHEPVFYQLGTQQMYEMRCELFEYSGETFDTGNTTIDSLYDGIETFSNNSMTFLENQDKFADNLSFENEANTFLDFTEENPFGDDRY